MVDDPLPDGDLPHRVGVDQQPVSGQEKQRIDAGADPQRQQAAHRAGGFSGIGDGQGHRRGRIPRDFAQRSKHARHNFW